MLLDKQNSKHLMTTSNRALPLYNGDQDHKYKHIKVSLICNKTHYERSNLNRGCIHLHSGRPDRPPPIPNPTPQGVCFRYCSPSKGSPDRGQFNDRQFKPFPPLTGWIEKRSGIGNKMQLSPPGDIPSDGHNMNSNRQKNNNDQAKYRI